MDFSTGLGLLAAAVVVPTMIFMGGDPRMFISDHAMIRPHLRVENPVAAQGPWNLSANRANPVRSAFDKTFMEWPGRPIPIRCPQMTLKLPPTAA